MPNPIFDLDSFEPLFSVGNDMAVDSEGHFKLRIGDCVAMDLDGGEMLFTTPWASESDSSD